MLFSSRPGPHAAQSDDQQGEPNPIDPVHTASTPPSSHRATVVITQRASFSLGLMGPPTFDARPIPPSGVRSNSYRAAALLTWVLAKADLQRRWRLAARIQIAALKAGELTKSIQVVNVSFALAEG